MDRATRNKFAAATPQKDLLYGEQACQETPSGVYTLLNNRYHFDVDLFANEQNHLCPQWFGPGAPPRNVNLAGFQLPVPLPRDNALDIPWTAYGKTGFANPPYGAFIKLALMKALAEQANGFTSAFLLPLRASKWYRDLVLPFYTELWHVEQRLMFTYKGEPARDAKGQPCSSLFDSIIVVFAPRPNTWLPGFPPQRPNVWNAKTGALKY